MTSERVVHESEECFRCSGYKVVADEECKTCEGTGRVAHVLRVGARRWPLAMWLSADTVTPASTLANGDPYPERTYCTRQGVVRFENSWGLSIIWGSLTYGSNYDHPHGRFHRWETTEFVEEPTLVEVAVFIPDAQVGKVGVVSPITKQHSHLFGDPYGYVSAEELVRLADAVAAVPSDTTAQPPDDDFYDDSNQSRLDNAIDWFVTARLLWEAEHQEEPDALRDQD